MAPRIVFCITCKGRAAHLEKTLPKNLADNEHYRNLAFVVLDYHGPDQALCDLARSYQNEIDRGRLTFYVKSGDGPFHMTHAKNMAHRLGMLEGADILVNLDADNFTGQGFAEYIAEQFSTKINIFLGPGNIKGQGKRFRGCSGRIACSVQQFLKVGGYDERFETWSPDDMDFNVRLQRSGYGVLEIERRFLQAIPHTDGLRFREYPHANDPTLDPYDLVHKLFSASTVVNYGRIGMGTVYRNFGVVPVILGPLPTRIFGIGLHKTATTSLHAALAILGFDSAHWKSGDWARDIWNEMNSLGKSKTLERNYALSDLPICLLYKQLDVAYPGSKFILTVRDELKWLESVRAHWSYDRNPHRWEWDTYPISNRLHQSLYGRKSFDAAVFRERYWQHNWDVAEYFKDRPADMLILNVDSGDGWRELCGFINKPIPACSYPKEYQTQ